MLVKFTVGNYLSFKEQVSLDLEAQSIKEFKENNTFTTPIENVELLKSVAIFGGNSSGKSNLFKAMAFAKKFIQNSSKNSQAEEKIDVESFRLSRANLNQPSHFEFVLIHNDQLYRYGFEVDLKSVQSEWLYIKRKTSENLLFQRTGQEIKIGNNYEKGSKKIVDITRDNALFLSVNAQFNIHLAAELIKEIGRLKFISGVDDQPTIDFTVELLKDPEINPIINNFLKGARLGFNEVKTENLELTPEILKKSGVPKEMHKLFLDSRKAQTIISTKHIVYDDNNNAVDSTYFDLYRNESLGTRKMFSLTGPIVDALMSGKTLIIDEFDSRLHPVLAKAIIKLFNSNQNVQNAQLLIASHNSSFINSSAKLFRRDQIIIVDKNLYGASNIETIHEKKIRKDASFEKDYLSGKYDGVPIDLELSGQLNLF